MKRLVIIIGVFALLFGGCKKKDENAYMEEANVCIQKLDVPGAVMAYEKLLEEFPTGQKASMVLYNLGRIYQDKSDKSLDAEQSSKKAISYYKQVVAKFPQAQQAPAALFNIAFIQANELRSFDEAKASYTQFIRDYPNDLLVPSAKAEIDNMGKSPEEIIQAAEAQAHAR